MGITPVIYNRKQYIKDIVLSHDEDSIYISSAGMISRDLYDIKDRARNFYMMGSLGCAIPFAIGLALKKKLWIYVFVGDGEALYNLGSLVLLAKLQKENKLKGFVMVHVLDNNEYQSTGGQKTCSDAIYFRAVAGIGNHVHVYNPKEKSPRIPLTPKEIMMRFKNAINSM